MRAFLVVALSIIFVLTFFESGFVSTGVVDSNPTAQTLNKNGKRPARAKPQPTPRGKSPSEKPPVNTNKPGGPQRNNNAPGLSAR